MGLAETFTASPKLRRAALTATVVLAVLIIGVSWATLAASRERTAARELQIHTLEVIAAAERAQADLFDAQRSVRGYLLVREPEFLRPYRYAAARLPLDLGELSLQTADNMLQQDRLMRLDAIIDRLLFQLAETVRVAEAGRSTADMLAIQRNEGERLTGVARTLFQQIVAEEQRLLRIRQGRVEDANRAANLAQYALVGVGGLLLLVAFGAGGLALRGAAAAERARIDAAVLARSRDELETAVIERTAALTAANAGLTAQIARAEAAEEQIRQMQKLESIGQLTGGIAHDFNNMLSIVIGSLDLARRRLGDGDDKVKQLIDNADAGAQRAAALTKRLLAFSRQQPLAPAPLDVNRLVTNMSELLRRTLGEQLRIETVLAGGLWTVNADAAELENAVVNLAVNARDAMAESGDTAGHLTIETNCTHLDDAYAAAHPEVTAGQYVALCVTDTGAGMPPDVIARAFDPFFTTKGVGKGSGLGLSQVFGFVKQSGGHVKIYSEPGKGTTVKIYLPRWHGPPPSTSPTATEPADAAPPRARPGETILVVEDEAQVRAVTIAALIDLGYAVHAAADGEEALRLLDAQPEVALLFTDIVMPGMNGRQLAEAATARRPGLKVLYTTGFTRNAVVHDGTLDADVAFLAKPYDVTRLAAKLRQVLDS